MAHGLALLNRCDEAGAIPVFDRIARLSRRQSLVFSADILSRVLRGGNEPAEGNSGAGAESSACRDIVLECAVNSLERCGSLSKAAALLEEMGLHPPGAAGWLVRRARLLRQAGDDRLAVAAYADALEKGASDPVINELHELMEARIAKEERSVLWQEIIRRNPNRVPLYLRLGRTLDAEEKRDEAQAAYREAFRLDGESPTCRLYLAQSLAGSGALDEALALAEQTDPLPDYLRPELAETYAIAGRYCISKDDWTRAASLFEKAITILPDNLWHKCWLAEAMVNLDRVDEARPLIFEILAAEPANQMALTLLQRVEEKPAAGGSN
jgi:tetratricopeptide (TPR) repeat protein